MAWLGGGASRRLDALAARRPCVEKHHCVSGTRQHGEGHAADRAGVRAKTPGVEGKARSRNEAADNVSLILEQRGCDP